MIDYDKNCPICKHPLTKKPNKIGDGTLEQTLYKYNCPVCGSFSITEDVKSFYLLSQDTRAIADENRALLCFAINNMQEKTPNVIIDRKRIINIINNQTLPTPAEQADNLILYIGDRTQTPGAPVHLNIQTDYAKIGANSNTNIGFIKRSLIDKKLLEKNSDQKPDDVSLTFDGWLDYERLKKGKADSNKAFMAMPFRKVNIDNLFRKYKNAAKKAGFKLIKNDEDPRAGLIDDKIRVNILTSKFIIAELTGNNAGAYWEAGYAEGLGKPVIYSCERSFFENKENDKKKGTHFDTNHLHTVLWEECRLEEAAEELKSVIRATLPANSILEDKEE